MRWLALAVLLCGCDNSCQQICARMAAYARECGHAVPDEQVDACRDAQAGDASAGDREICRGFGSRRAIRDEWTCDDLAAYWSRVEPVGDTAW